MTAYHSTRSAQPTVPAKEAIRTGLAPDGGLYVSDWLENLEVDLGNLAQMSYAEIAQLVLGALLPDFTPEEVAACVDRAYTGTFASSEVTPVVPVGGNWVLELFHGPTCAFKDVALQMLPQLMACSAKAAAREAASAGAPAADKIMIVTATSGDTGKAALAGFADKPDTGITVFYPEGKVSAVQQLQMTTQVGSNVAVCAVRGNFDDAQSAVKRAFGDRELAERLAERGVVLSSANSINVGRLVPQVVYYFAAYAQLLRAGAIAAGDPVEFCVPTGNFGDVLAGYYAKRMGLPVARLIVASNRNNVLADFLTTGVYDRNRPFFTTISPSMDILISSNLERMLYYAGGKDCELIARLMDDLAKTGRYEVPASLKAALDETFACAWASDDEQRAAIKRCWDGHAYLMDPHTACAWDALEKVEALPGVARVVLSTASPYKFPEAVCAALGVDVPAEKNADGTPREPGFAAMDALEAATGTPAPAQLRALETAPVRFADVVDPAGIGAYVERQASEKLG